MDVKNGFIVEEEEKGVVNDWIKRLCDEERPSTLRSFIESFESEIKSNDRIIRENAVKRICMVISELPQNYQWNPPQVELLLDFLLANCSDSLDCTLLAAIKNLLFNSPHLPGGYIQIIIEKLFHQCQIQACIQKERYIFFQILEFLLQNYHKELSANVYFISYFISSVSGERDPRCLVIVFRLFYIICNYFNCGNFPRNLFDIHASDLFDVVACYFPIEFKQSLKERTEITREMLISGCESCLLADEEFAPFVFQLITEKLTDNELSFGAKLEVCMFLAKACATFTTYKLDDHIDELCAGIRSILFNLPETKTPDGIPQPINEAVSALIKALEKGSIEQRKQRIEYVCLEFIRNSEMFALQAELGLTGRVLSFFELLIKSSEFCVEIVFESIFSWLLSLCRGDTVNFAVNKTEIIDSSLKSLCHWIDLAFHFEQATLMEKYHTKFTEIFDKYDREIAQSTIYKLLEVYTRFHMEEDGLLDKCKVFFRKSFDFACTQNKDLKNNCLLFVHVFSQNQWVDAKAILASEIDAGKEISCLAPVLWSTIHDTESLNFALSHLATLLPSSSAWSDDYQENFINVFKWNKSENNSLLELLLKQTLDCCFTKFDCGMECEKELEIVAEFLQKIGLELDERTHLEGLHTIREKLNNHSTLIPALYLYIIQSGDSDELLSILAQLSSSGQELSWYKSLIVAAAVNKSSNYVEALDFANRMLENFDFVDSFKCRCRLCVALLLAGHAEGFTYFNTLLQCLVEHFDASVILTLTNAVVDMLTFDRCYSDPIKCRYRTTLLWQQRIFCQLVPVYVQYCTALGKELHSKQTVLYALLSPLFTLAGSLASVVNDTYVKLLPVLCSALDTLSLDVSSEEIIISSLTKLLKNATSKELDGDFLLKILPRLQHSLDNTHDMKVLLASLECLKLIAERWPPSTVLQFYNPVVCSLIKVSRSQKRIIRRTVADVRNTWELLATKGEL